MKYISAPLMMGHSASWTRRSARDWGTFPRPLLPGLVLLLRDVKIRLSWTIFAKHLLNANQAKALSDSPQAWLPRRKTQIIRHQGPVQRCRHENAHLHQCTLMSRVYRATPLCTLDPFHKERRQAWSYWAYDTCKICITGIGNAL